MKILALSSLYPSSARPHYGLFVETRLQQLILAGGVEARVVAPVPWFPFRNPRFGHYASMARTPRVEVRESMQITHPRYPTIPKLGSALAPLLMAAAAGPELARIRLEGFDFELIDAHYFYPDGVAAALLARRFGVPFVVTARGSDLNLHAREMLVKRWIVWAAHQAAKVVTVSEALQRRAMEIGIPRERTAVLRNGVDVQRFAPRARAAIRNRLALDGLVLLSAGNLVAEKGHALVLEATRLLPDATLVFAGDGPHREALARRAVEWGLGGRVRFLGAIAQDQLIDYYNAADVLVLASEREGWPNVLLEAMACGTPVVAADVGGCREIVTAPAAGTLVRERSAQAFADAIRTCLVQGMSREAPRRHAEQFGWGSTSAGQLEIFRAAIAGAKQAHVGGAGAATPC